MQALCCMKLTEEAHSRIVARTVRDGECMIWTGACDTDGYGRVTIRGRGYTVSRLVWEFHHGAPGTLCVLHRCDRPPCANICHLFLGTRADNNADKAAKGRASRLVGSRNPRTKIADDVVNDLRSAVASGESITSAARRLGVGRANASLIVNNKRRQEVK